MLLLYKALTIGCDFLASCKHPGCVLYSLLTDHSNSQKLQHPGKQIISNWLYFTSLLWLQETPQTESVNSFQAKDELYKTDAKI